MQLDLFRYRDGTVPNLIGFSYVALGYPSAVYLLTFEAWWANALGVLLLTHVLSIASYFTHEFAHQTIFKSPSANRKGGEFMNWIHGTCYTPFDNLRKMHMRHHVDRADIVAFDHTKFFREAPKPVVAMMRTLEWAYIPATEIFLHIYVMFMPFLNKSRPEGKVRSALVFIFRSAAFALLFFYSPNAVGLYFVSYLIFITVLRLGDAFHHTYVMYEVTPDGPLQRDESPSAEYEQANTYSNLIMKRYPLLDLLLLNFSYHNAHHERPIAAWHQLPRLHDSLYGDQTLQVLTMGELLRSYHRYRVDRVISDHYGTVKSGANRAASFAGAYGVSFLTAV